MEQLILQPSANAPDNRDLFLQKRSLLELCNEANWHRQVARHKTLCYYGIMIRFEFHDESMMAPLFQNFTSSFFPQKTGNDLVVRIFSPKLFSLFPRNWEDEASSDLYCGTINNSIYAIQRDFIALSHEQNPNLFYALWDPNESDGAFNCLRWILPWALLKNDMALLHSSAWLDTKGQAHVVMGKSGAGKTTLAKKALPRPVVGDDMNVVMFDGRQLLLGPAGLGTAFDSIAFDQVWRPVVACYRPVKKSTGLDLTVMTKSALVRLILSSLANISWSFVDSTVSLNILRRLSASLSNIKAYDLAFSLDSEVWNDIYPNNEN